MKLLNSDQSRRAEQLAEQAGISAGRLMENAGAAAAKAIALDETVLEKRVVVVAGSGNNAGDGFVVARKLKEYGAQVTVLLVMGMPTTPNSRRMLERLQPLNITVLNYYDNPDYAAQLLARANLLIDAIFGIGFHGAVDRELEQIIALMNRSLARTVSLDLPSGVQCDTGAVFGAAVRAVRTVSFMGYKPCHFIFPAAEYCGQVHCVSIGVSEAQTADCAAVVLEPKQALAALTPIAENAHKGSKGTALIFAGSYKMPGAACFAALAAMRTGAGFVRLVLPKPAYPLVAPLVPEAVFEPYEAQPEALDETWLLGLLEKADSVLIGPGMGTGDMTEKLLRLVLQHAAVPVIVDADALNVLAHNKALLQGVKAPVILTPHPGEMARLTGKSVAELEQNRLQTATDFAEKNGVITLLKGAYTVIAEKGEKPFVNVTGNACMATAGSGDMLSGILAALAANGTEPLLAAAAGACLHGLAGDAVRAKMGLRGATVRDLLNELPNILP